MGNSVWEEGSQVSGWHKVRRTETLESLLLRRKPRLTNASPVPTLLSPIFKRMNIRL